MKLVFRGHDDRYAVEQSLLAFFPEERPVYQEPGLGVLPTLQEHFSRTAVRSWSRTRAIPERWIF